MSVVLCFCFCSAFSALGAKGDELQFDKDGKFRILNLSDLHVKGKINNLEKAFLEGVIKDKKPNLVVLTGDIIVHATNEDEAKKSIGSVMSVLDKLGVPVCLTFGNHDDEDGVSKETQLKIYQSYDCFIGEDVNPALFGCATQNLKIKSSDGKKTAFNIWLFDSGTYSPDAEWGYSWVRDDQLEWYQNTANALKAENGGEVVPSIAFQHIIVPEIYLALEKTDKKGENVIEKDGVFYTLPAGAKGCLHEAPCPPKKIHGEFSAFKEVGDVLAVVSGHDHKNTFEIDYDGIKLINTPSMCTSTATYNERQTRGGRLFVIDENNPQSFKTEFVSAEPYQNTGILRLEYLFTNFAIFFEYQFKDFILELKDKILNLC